MASFNTYQSIVTPNLDPTLGVAPPPLYLGSHSNNVSKFSLKPMLPSLISGIGNLVGGIFSSRSQRKANEMNLQIAREQNQFNLKQWERERDYNTQMYDDQKAYNDPRAQVARFKNAGLNPYMMLGSVDSGSVSNITAPHANPAAGAQMQPADYTYMGEALNNSIRMFFESKLQSKAVDRADLENQILASQASVARARANEELANLKADTGVKNSTKLLNNKNYDIAEATLGFMDKTEDARIVGINADNYLKRTQYELNEISKESEKYRRDLLKFDLDVKEPALLASQLALNAAMVRNYITMADLNEEQAEKVYEETFLTVLKQKGQQIDNQKAEKIMPHLIRGAMANSFGHDKYNQWLGGGVALGVTAAGGQDGFYYRPEQDVKRKPRKSKGKR